MTSNEKFIVVYLLILSHNCLSLPFMGAFLCIHCEMLCDLQINLS